MVTRYLLSLVVFGLMGPEFENVKESWFLIMLFTDIPKVTRMAQFALTSSQQRRIPANVAVGMAQLGPAMSFETLGKILVVGLCGLTNYTRLELLASYAIITVVVDFLTFMRCQIDQQTDVVVSVFCQFLPSRPVSGDRADVHKGGAAAVGREADHQVSAL